MEKELQAKQDAEFEKLNPAFCEQVLLCSCCARVQFVRALCPAAAPATLGLL
jgi:hypothetical protein